MHEDYMPHFPTEMTLSDIVVGKTEWAHSGKAYGAWSRQFGYLDNKVYHNDKSFKRIVFMMIKLARLCRFRTGSGGNSLTNHHWQS